jgi:tRNA dimethylallyltransferase
VGKSTLALAIARRAPAEIVVADSMQIYRGMDIGTAKPTKDQRKLVYHHMIDIADPGQLYSVGDYLRDARAALDGIISSGGVPIVVGGTGLYIRALTRGLFYGPPADVELRGRLLQKEADGNEGALYAELVKVDPDAAVKIHPNDLRRTVRALEVYYLRDRTISDFQQEHSFNDRPYQFRLLFLTRERSELYPRIERRVDRMIADGLEAEVRSFFDQGYADTLSSMQGLGYKHFMDFFHGRYSREDAVALLKRDTKRYAKRQFTWFRREAEAVWVDITGLVLPEEIAERIKKNIEM